MNLRRRPSGLLVPDGPRLCSGFGAGCNLAGFWAGGGVASLSFQGSTVSTSDLTTYTFSSHAIGTAAGDRKVVVTITGNNSTANRSVSSVTIGGVSASQVQTSSQGLLTVDVWQASVPSGTTADIVVEWSGAQGRTGIGVYAVYGAATAAHDTDTTIVNPGSITIDVPAGGVAIGVYGSDGATATYTWSGIIENYDETMEASNTHTGASATFAAQQSGLSITITPSGATADEAGVVASWGPGS